MNNKTKIRVDVIVILMLIMIILGKALRYTILKSSLVDEGIGNGWINNILTFNVEFKFFEFGQNTTSSNSGGNSEYLFAVLFYPLKYIGINDYLSMEIVISIIMNLLLGVSIVKSKSSYTIIETGLICIMVLFLNVWCFTLAKEPIQFLIFFLMYLVLKSDLKNFTKLIFNTIILLISAIVLRQYFFLVLLFGYSIFLASLIVGKINKGRSFIFFIALINITFAFFAFAFLLKRVSVVYYNEFFRVGSSIRNENANTVIVREFLNSNNIVLLFVDFLITTFKLLFPYELLNKGAYYLLFFVCQTFITIYLIYSMLKVKKEDYSRIFSLIIFIAFILTSACFEPDYGSWIRHEMVLTPILIFAFGFAN